MLVVTHGMSILAMISDLTNDFLKVGLDNASITKIIYKDGKFKIEELGNMKYVGLGSEGQEEKLTL